MLIQTISGQETFSDRNGGEMYAGSVRVELFYRRTALDKDMPLAMAPRDPESRCQRLGNEDQLPASRQNRNHGVWVTGRYQVPEDAVLTLRISKKTGRSMFYTTSLFMISMREDAAFRRLRIPFTGNPNASVSHGMIEGHFDLVPVNTIGTIHLPFNDFRADQFESDYTDWFQDEIVERERRRKPVNTEKQVVTEKGRTINVTRAPKARVIRVNR